MNGSGFSFQQTFVGSNAHKALKTPAWEAISNMQTLQSWYFNLLLGVWISHETISCCVVFAILHGEKICAVLGKNMANINCNRFQQD